MKPAAHARLAAPPLDPRHADFLRDLAQMIAHRMRAADEARQALSKAKHSITGKDAQCHAGS